VELFRLPETVSLTGVLHMLLLTLFLWWAHAPMRCFDGRLRKGISIVAIAILAFPCGNLIPACVADDRFGGGVGRSTLAWVRDAEEEESENLTKHQMRLREGTLVPTTVGRVVLAGRRWAFIASAPESETADDIVETDKSFRASLVGFNSKPRPSRLGQGNKPIATTNVAQTETLAASPTKSKRPANILPPRIILAENLMLQRIVTAIRADLSDDHWTVTGEIIEFFDDNQLVIRTAQRTNSH
jgi:hypothetical protein